MKFTDGFWEWRAGVSALWAREAYDIRRQEDSVVTLATTSIIEKRGDTLNRPVLTVTLTSPMDGVVGVRVEHFQGVKQHRRFDIRNTETPEISVEEEGASLTAGELTATIKRGSPWDLSFSVDGQVIVKSAERSLVNARTPDGIFTSAQLSLGVGEFVYGLGERFGPYVKNGQSIDMWNSDGGTSSDLAYKNVPFYLTNAGYGVLVNDSGPVSYEIGSEAVERVQFSVPGESLEYFVIAGKNPKQILERYTRLTGRPAAVPAWSYGLWLTTSFTTQYDEATVSSFIDGMATRDIPLSVFHFDCFWMREFTWCDFEWDARVFPDPHGMLQRLHGKDLHICVWINPYIAQAASIFDEARDAGFLLTRANGDVWQWDKWQAGMGLVDFTNPAAVEWFKSKLRVLLDQGVDAFKTDFGERIPTDVVYFDGSDPVGMHNKYTLLYNKAVFEVLQEVRGDGDAVVFARSATVGSQAMPVHWGGDSTSTYESMAETLRGGLSLAMSGFGFWSHDIGGFEGTPDAGVFMRWVAFGMLSSHSRLHGSDSYRVPWNFSDEAVDVTRFFTKLKLKLMPYLYAAGIEATRTGIPLMRPMQLEFPNDPAVSHLDRQYMLGGDILVAPVFDKDGCVDFYLPAGTWTNYLTNEQRQGGRWFREHHDYFNMPIWVRQGAVIPVGSRDDRPDYEFLDGLVLEVYPPLDGNTRIVTVTDPNGHSTDFTVSWSQGRPQIQSSTRNKWTIRERLASQ